jgi:hypothetical protein
MGGRSRVGAGGDDGAPSPETPAVHRDLVGRREAGFVPQQDLYPQLPEAGWIVVLAGGPDDPVHPVHHGREVNLGPIDLDTVLLRVVYEARYPGALDQGLGGNAPAVEAFATELVPLHEGNLSAQRGRSGGGDESSGPAPDNDQVIL